MANEIKSRTQLIQAVANWPDEKILALTLWGEIRGGTAEQRANVAHVIRNRVRAKLRSDGADDWWGEGWRGVCLARAQFSCWWDAQQIRMLQVPENDLTYQQLLTLARQIMSWNGTDPTNRSTHYHTVIKPNSARTWPPAWGELLQHKTISDGLHQFYREPTARFPEDAAETLARSTATNNTGPNVGIWSILVEAASKTDVVKEAAENLGIGPYLPYITMVTLPLAAIAFLVWRYRRALGNDRPWALWLYSKLPRMPWEKS